MALEEIQITDWQNYHVKNGDVISAVFTVASPLAAVLNGSKMYINDPLVEWLSAYGGVGAGGVKGYQALPGVLLNKVLAVVTPIGPLKEKIQIDYTGTYFYSNCTRFRVTFTVIQNAWPLLYFLGALGAIVFGYLTVREVRLYKQITEGVTPPSATGVISEIADTTKTAAGAAVILLVAGLIYFFILKK